MTGTGTARRHDFTPPPFSFALMGHFVTGTVKAAVIALLLWGAGRSGIASSFPLSTAIITAVVVMIAVELVTAVVERLFVLRHQHPDPGSIAMTFIVAVTPLPISAVVGLLVAPPPSGAVTTVVASVVVYWLAMALLERPWIAGDSQEDIRRKMKETTAMTREHFSDD